MSIATCIVEECFGRECVKSLSERSGRYAHKPPLSRAQGGTGRLRRRHRSTSKRATTFAKSRAASSGRSSSHLRATTPRPSSTDNPAVSSRYGPLHDGHPSPSSSGPSLQHMSLPPPSYSGSTSFTARPRAGRAADGRRPRRVRPCATVVACQRSISGRSQSMGRPGPRFTTGRGMSGYRVWYLLTVFRWASPRMAATSWASMRLSTRTLRDISKDYACDQTTAPRVVFSVRSHV
jgi:hypothetical protein